MSEDQRVKDGVRRVKYGVLDRAWRERGGVVYDGLNALYGPVGLKPDSLTLSDLVLGQPEQLFDPLIYFIFAQTNDFTDPILVELNSFLCII